MRTFTAALVLGILAGCAHSAGADNRAIMKHLTKAHFYAAEARRHARMGEALLAEGRDDASSKEFEKALEAHNKQVEEQDKALALQKAEPPAAAPMKASYPPPAAAK